MKKSVSSTLLSAFVFPGIGQINNRQPLKGIILILLSTLTFVFFLFRIAGTVLRAIPEPDRIALSPDVIASITQKVHAENQELILFTILILGLIWAFSIVDAYRFGKKIGKKSPL